MMGVGDDVEDRCEQACGGISVNLGLDSDRSWMDEIRTECNKTTPNYQQQESDIGDRQLQVREPTCLIHPRFTEAATVLRLLLLRCLWWSWGGGDSYGREHTHERAQ